MSVRFRRAAGLRASFCVRLFAFGPFLDGLLDQPLIDASLPVAVDVERARGSDLEKCNAYKSDLVHMVLAVWFVDHLPKAAAADAAVGRRRQVALAEDGRDETPIGICAPCRG